MDNDDEADDDCQVVEIREEGGDEYCEAEAEQNGVEAEPEEEIVTDDVTIVDDVAIVDHDTIAEDDVEMPDELGDDFKTIDETKSDDQGTVIFCLSLHCSFIMYGCCVSVPWFNVIVTLLLSYVISVLFVMLLNE